MESAVAASMPARRMPMAAAGGNQWRKRYLAAMNINAPPPAPSTVAVASVAPTVTTSSHAATLSPRTKRASLPAYTDAAHVSPHPRGSSPDTSVPVEPIPLEADELFDVFGTAARFRSKSVGDALTGRTAAVPIPVSQAGGQGRIPSSAAMLGVPQAMMRRQSTDTGSAGDDSFLASPAHQRHPANKSMMSEEEDDVFGFGNDGSFTQKDGNMPAHRMERLGSDEGSVSTGSESLPRKHVVTGRAAHASYAAAVVNSPAQKPSSMTDSSVSPLVAPLALLELSASQDDGSWQAANAVGGRQRPRREFADQARDTPVRSLTGTDETGSRSKKHASDIVSTTTEGEEDASVSDYDDIVTGVLLEDGALKHNKREAAKRGAKSAKNGAARKLKHPVERVRANSIGSASSSSMIGGRMAHIAQGSPVSVSGRGHHPGSPMQAMLDVPLFDPRLLQSAQYSHRPAPEERSETDDVDDEEEDEEDDEDEDEDEAGDDVGSLPMVLPVGKLHPLAGSRATHASYALRPHSSAVAIGNDRVQPAAAGKVGAANSRGVRGTTHLAAVSAAELQLGSSFVPPHLLVAADAAKDDVFSMGVRAQVKAKPRNV